VTVLRPCHNGLIAFFLVAIAGVCGAQATSELFSLAAKDSAPAFVSGINFSINSAAQHSSLTGWSGVVTPEISYRFNRHFLVDARIPWYLTVKNFVPKKVNNVVTYPLMQTQNVIGDTATSGYYKTNHKDFGYMAGATVGFASGNSQFGLSSNTTTYNVSNLIEYSVGPFNPDIEFGVGNSSSLLHQTITKSYTAVGQLANFQAGTDIDLPQNISLDLEAYENLPLGNQNVYGTITTKAKSGKITTTTILEGHGVAEDNGFTAELNIPLNAHFTLTGSYQRSIIQSMDLAGISITWRLRAPKKRISIDSLIPDQ